MHNSEKSSGKRRGKIRLPVALMLLVSMSASVVLAGLGVHGYREHMAGTSYYSGLSTGLKSATAAPTAEPTAAPTATPKKPSMLFTPLPREGAAQRENEIAATAAPAAPAQKKQRTSALDFAALRETCPDVVGWVTIPDTVIDYPIVHGEDNDFYLTHLPDRTKNAAGSIMMDVANSGDFTDDVSILHGHHMRSGAMFGDLELYKKEAYYKEHPMMRLFTPDGDYDVAIFAAYSVDGSTFAYPTNFTGEEGFSEFYHRATTRTPYKTDVEVAYGDRMLMLSTCAYSYDYERFLVVGKILPPEDE